MIAIFREILYYEKGTHIEDTCLLQKKGIEYGKERNKKKA